MTAATVTWQFRRGVAAAWAGAGDPVLAPGEPAVLLDDAGRVVELRIGDGSLSWSMLPPIAGAATGDMTGEQIAAAYEAVDDVNRFDDAAVGKLAGIEPDATGDMTSDEIAAAYEAVDGVNRFDDAAVGKLAGIEPDATAGGLLAALQVFGASDAPPGVLVDGVYGAFPQWLAASLNQGWEWDGGVLTAPSALDGHVAQLDAYVQVAVTAGVEFSLYLERWDGVSTWSRLLKESAVASAGGLVACHLTALTLVNTGDRFRVACVSNGGDATLQPNTRASFGALAWRAPS
ncbi:MAG: hypothetical protein AAFX81_15995 [Pseudomonadota bacterium]